MTRRQTTIEARPPRIARLHRSCAALAAVIALGLAASASAAPSSNWLDYTAIANDRLDIGSNIEVGGNYAVIQPGGRLTLGTNLFHSSVPADSFLAADRMEFVTGASANNVFVNTLQLNGTAEVRGTLTKPHSFPLTINVPSLPAGVTDPCASSAANVTVAANQTLTLAAGCYRNVLVRHDATLELSGGDYVFRHVLIETDAQLVAEAATTISIQQNLTTELRSAVFAQSGNAADLLIFTAGTSNRIGNDALFLGRIVAPNDGNFEFGVRATFIGNAYADEMNIFGVHLVRTPTPIPTKTPTPTPTFTPFVPPTPTPTPTPTPVGPTPTPTPPGQTPTPTPPGQTPTPTPFDPPTPTEPFTPPEKCPAFTSPQPC